MNHDEDESPFREPEFDKQYDPGYWGVALAVFIVAAIGTWYLLWLVSGAA